jgi:hypothetical protein
VAETALYLPEMHHEMARCVASIRDRLDKARRLAQSGEGGPTLTRLIEDAYGSASAAARFYGPGPFEAEPEAPARKLSQAAEPPPLTPSGVVTALAIDDGEPCDGTCGAECCDPSVPLRGAGVLFNDDDIDEPSPCGCPPDRPCSFGDVPREASEAVDSLVSVEVSS